MYDVNVVTKCSFFTSNGPGPVLKLDVLALVTGTDLNEKNNQWNRLKLHLEPPLQGRWRKSYTFCVYKHKYPHTDSLGQTRQKTYITYVWNRIYKIEVNDLSFCSMECQKRTEMMWTDVNHKYPWGTNVNLIVHIDCHYLWYISS